MSIMLYPPILLPPSADGWDRLAHALAGHDIVRKACPVAGDYSGLRVVVPTVAHAPLLKAALAVHLQRSFIAPRITTLADWLALPPQLPSQEGRQQAVAPAGQMARLTALYAEMRRHPWLRRLFHAQRNTDLLPVAQSLLALFDELSDTMLPSMQVDADASAAEWRTALERLSLPAKGIASDEARLVWTLWQGQLGADDPAAVRLARMNRLAESADAPLIWIDDGLPQPMNEVFLDACAQRFPVLRVVPDWRREALAAVYASAWPEVLDELDDEEEQGTAAMRADPVSSVFLHPARSLEDEARHAAQTVIQWLHEGRTRIAVIAQDPAAARRMKALLGRAGLAVSDETERKLAATRPAAMLAALIEVAASRADAFALLDLLKCPGLCEDLPDKAELVIEIELALRRANVLGGWHAVLGAVTRQPRARMLLLRIAGQAWRFAGRKTVRGWARLTADALQALGMRDAMEADAAGIRVLVMLDKLAHEVAGPRAKFGLAEWRAMLGMQLDAMACPASEGDPRVTMLPLAGARLRRFDAVIMVGADSVHLPEPAGETLRFASAVRRELSLSADDMRQRMQLRSFAELLNANPEVVLCWQATRDSESNAASSWMERLQLVLEQSGNPSLPLHQVIFSEQRLRASPPRKPMPAAPDLLPAVLSAQGYHSLIACPYQFFATRMLGLARLEELSELPEKRDYGGWLHAILKIYHETVRDNAVAAEARESLLRDITEQVFKDALMPGAEAPGALVLGYYARWQKAIPAYLEWAGEREASGWRFVFGEQMLERVLEWEGGRIVLRGRVDRIDERADGSRAILDYKAQSLPVLRDKLRDGDDHQLAFRAALSDAPVTAGHLVALETSRNKTGDAAAEHFIEWQGRLEGQIVRNMRAIAGGAALPAAGIERICIHCEVRGLCRKGAW